MTKAASASGAGGATDMTAVKAGLTTERDTTEASAKALVVSDAEEYKVAAGFILDIGSLLKKIGATFDPMQKATHEAHKTVCAERKALENPLRAALQTVKGKMGTWSAEEQRRLDRIAAEEAAAQRQLDDEERLRTAEALAQAGETEAADDVMAEEVAPPPITPTRAAPKVEGVSEVTVWKAEVTSLKELVKAVAAGTVPLSAVEPAGVSFWNQQARSLKKELNWPGVRVWSETSTRAGSR